MKQLLNKCLNSYWIPTTFIWLTVAIAITLWVSQRLSDIYLFTIFVVVPSTFLLVVIAVISQLVRRKWKLAIINLLGAGITGGLIIGTILVILAWGMFESLADSGLSSLIKLKKVHETDIYLNNVSSLTTIDSHDYMNSLMLSPYWYVHKRGNLLFASARSVDLDVDSFDQIDDDFYLFENKDFVLKDSNISVEAIRNHGIDEMGGTQRIDANTSFPAYSYSIDVDIIYEKPTGNSIICDKLSHFCQLEVYEDTTGGNLGNQFSSTFILSLNPDLYLQIKEISPDQERKRTKRIIENITSELLNYSSRENTCQALTRKDSEYTAFLQKMFLTTTEPAHIKRGSGIQDRFAFYGYIQSDQLADPQLPISIMISNHDICAGECTSSSARIEKEEFLGDLKCDGFPHFFSIEDNAIYIPYDQLSQFGHFSGNTQFSADVSLMQSNKAIYTQNFEGFTGWER